MELNMNAKNSIYGIKVLVKEPGKNSELIATRDVAAEIAKISDTCDEIVLPTKQKIVLYATKKTKAKKLEPNVYTDDGKSTINGKILVVKKDEAGNPIPIGPIALMEATKWIHEHDVRYYKPATEEETK